MYGLFDLTFATDGSMPVNMKSFNHLTKAGMAVLFNKTWLDQPNVTFNGSGRYQNTLNYFFVIVDNGQPLPFDIDSLDIDFADIKHYPHSFNDTITFWDQSSAAAGSIERNLYPEGQDSVTILGAGLAYHEVGGDGSKDFVWSITKLDTPAVLSKQDQQEYPDRPQTWSTSYSYSMQFSGNCLPEITTTIDGTEYKFVSDPLGEEAGTGYIYNPYNALERLPYDLAYFTVNGGRFTPATQFKEIKTDDPLMRKFEIAYTNKRAANSVDISGFALALCNNIFSYRLEYGKYLVLPAGKTFKITIAVGLEMGWPAAVVNNGLDFIPTPYYSNALGQIGSLIRYSRGNLKVDKVYLTGSANTPNAHENTAVPNPEYAYIDLSDVPSIGCYNTELSKVELGIGGRRSRPLYILRGGDPTVVPIQRPDMSTATDSGWRIDNDVIVFRVVVPADITHLQVALDDGVWFDYPVTAGQVNNLTLDKRFVYNNWMYMRWKNGTTTGVILLYRGLFKTGTPLVEPYYFYRRATTTGNSNRKYYIMGKMGASGLPCSNVPRLDDTTFSGGGIAENKRDHYVGGYETPNDYNGTFPQNIYYTFLPDVKYLQNDLTLKAIPEHIAGTFHVNGDETKLPWKLRPEPIDPEDPAVTVPRTNIPRAVLLDLKPYPTEASPNKVTIQTTLQTRKARIRRLSDDVVMGTVEAPENGHKTVFTTTDKMFNHLQYGVDLLDEAGTTVVSPQPAVFYGASLDVPAPITDYSYDDQNYVIQFTTPDRAMRAAIKQFGIEVFSFECVQGGVTKFFMSKPLNMTQRYELWLFNANNETWEEPYVMVDVPEVDEKPTSTGPYTYPEWTNPTDADTIPDTQYGTNLTFADIKRWDRFPGLFKVRIDGQDTDQEIIRNEHGVIKQILFNAGLLRFRWTTGYDDSAVDYSAQPRNSGITVLYMSGQKQIMTIDVWHEWEKYALIDEASFGVYNGSSTWTPYYGQTTGKFQKTEIINGYIRNTYRLRYKPQIQPRVCPLYHLQAGNYSKNFRNANIYILADDLVGSPNAGNNSGYPVTRFVPIIDGKTAKWDLTRNASEQVIKARCFNEDQTSFTYDTAKPTDGWVCDNFDPDVEGTEGATDIYHTLEFCLDKGYWDGVWMSYQYNSTGGDKPPNADGELQNSGYTNAIFAVVYPYAPVPTWDNNMGGQPSTMDYWSNNPQSVNQAMYQFQDAYVSITDYAKFLEKMDDSVVWADGVKGSFVKQEVTLTYTPSLANWNDYDVNTNPNAGVSTQPTLEPFTYQALVITVGDYTISNRKNPYVFTVDARPAGAAKTIKLQVGRKNFTTEPYPIDVWNGSKNTNITGIWFSDYRKYWSAFTIVFHPVPDKLLKFEADLPDPSTIEVDESKSRYNHTLLQVLVGDIIENAVIFDWENVSWGEQGDWMTPVPDFVLIDGAQYTIEMNPQLQQELSNYPVDEETTRVLRYPIPRDFDVWAARVVKADTPSTYIEFDMRGNQKYIGFTPGVHRLSLNFSAADNYTGAIRSWIINNMENLENTFMWAMGTSPTDAGYTEVKAVNYILSDIATGFGVNFNIQPFTILDASTAVPDFTPDFGPSYGLTAPTSRLDMIRCGLNPYYFDENLASDAVPDIGVTMNGRPYDTCTIWDNPELDGAAEGDPPRMDHSEPLMVRSFIYHWAAEQIALILHVGPFALYNSFHTGVEDVSDPLNIPPMDNNYSGDRLVFELTGTNGPSNGTRAIPFTNSDWRYGSTAYGLPVTKFDTQSEQIVSVTNGEDVYSRWEIVLGQLPITEEEFDPNIGPSFYEGMNYQALRRMNPNSLGESGVGDMSSGGPQLASAMKGPVEDEGYGQDVSIVPNFFQYPHTAFAVRVNGVEAEFIAPSPEYHISLSDIRLDNYQNPPSGMWGQSAKDNGMTAVLRMYASGELEQQGDITGFCNPSFVGPAGNAPMMMAADDEPTPLAGETGETGPGGEVSGIYLYRAKSSDIGGTYDYTGVPTIICAALDVVIVFDYDRQAWRLYTGDDYCDYFIEFRYKRLFDPFPEEPTAAPVLLATDIYNHNVNNGVAWMVANNMKVVANATVTDKFELSWIDRVEPRQNQEVCNGYVYKGLSVPSGSTLEKYIPAARGLDETYAIVPISKVSTTTLAVTINQEPAILDLSNYSATDFDHLASPTYQVTEVAADNEYPVRGSMGNITASNNHGTILYDVATGTWVVQDTPALGQSLTVGLTSVRNGEDAADFGYDGGGTGKNYIAYGHSPSSECVLSVAFRLSGKPANATDPTVPAVIPNLAEEFMDYNVRGGGEGFAIPNYELFDPLDFTCVMNGVPCDPPVVETDTHGVPISYTWTGIPEAEFSVILDVVNRVPIFDYENEVFDDPTFGVIPLAREDALTENDTTRLFTRRLAVTVQWNYNKLLDITDTRPVFLSMNSGSEIYTDVEVDSPMGYVDAQGTKKTVAVISALLDFPVESIAGAKSNQLFWGWLPTGYTGTAFNLENLPYVGDDQAALPLTGSPEHSAEVTLRPTGLTNNMPS